MSNTNTLTTALKLTPYAGSGSYPYGIVNNDWLPTAQGYTAGTATGSIDSLAQTSVTATTSGATIQLNASNVTDIFGNTLSYLRVDAIGMFNSGTSATVTVLGNYIKAQYGTNGITLPPLGAFAHYGGTNSATGFATGAGTNSTLTFISSAGTAAVQLVIAGRSV